MLKRIIVFVYLISTYTFVFSQDQLIYKNGKSEYIDSICVMEDTLLYYNFKKPYKIPSSKIDGYFLTIRTKENLEKGFYRRERQYINISNDTILSKKSKIDTSIVRDYVLKTTIPFLNKGIYDINWGFEKYFRKKSTINANFNLLIFNDFDLSFENFGVLIDSENEVNHNINGFGTFLTGGYRYYIIPFRKFKPGGIYLGAAGELMYVNVNNEVKYYLNDILEHHYKVYINSYGINLGAIAGVQWLIASRVCLNIDLSVYGSINNSSQKSTEYVNNGYEINDISMDNKFINLTLYLGYAFNRK